MMPLTKLHYLIGALFFVLFLLTGAYMKLNFPDLYMQREEIRMMYRATHIYILMSALINLMTANYLFHSHDFSFHFLKKIASACILISPLLFTIAFFYESGEYLINRPVSFWGVILLLGGVMLHALLNFRWLTNHFK